jgi:putative membrane protein
LKKLQDVAAGVHLPRAVRFTSLGTGLAAFACGPGGLIGARGGIEMQIGWKLAGLSASALLALGAPAWGAPDDADFVKAAANAGMMEVELGKHAAQHGADAQVRAFGERMVTDHGKANQELKGVAQRAGLAVPSQMDEEHRDKLQKLSKLRGAEFDKAYMDEMVKGHEHVIEAFEDQAKEPTSELDHWAAKTLPTLQAHLQQAEKVAESVEGAEGSAGGGSSNLGGDAGRALDPSVTGVPGRP